MKYLRIALLFFPALLPAQQVTASVSFTFPQTVLQDIFTHWTDQTISASGVLSTPIANTDTTVVLSQVSNIVAGSVILIDSEPMSVTQVSGTTLVVTRGAAVAPLTVAIAHSANAPIHVLKYASPWSMLATEAVLPWAHQITNVLGSRSATFSYSATGTVTGAQ
jgi:hypothetical protein